MSEDSLSHQFTLQIGDTSQDIKMSFGLLNELVRVIGDLESVPELSFDIELRENVLQQVLATRDKNGQIKEQVNLFNLDVTSDSIVELLAWVGEHVTDFLVKQLTRTKELMDRAKPLVEALKPT